MYENKYYFLKSLYICKTWYIVYTELFVHGVWHAIPPLTRASYMQMKNILFKPHENVKWINKSHMKMNY